MAWMTPPHIVRCRTYNKWGNRCVRFRWHYQQDGNGHLAVSITGVSQRWQDDGRTKNKRDLFWWIRTKR